MNLSLRNSIFLIVFLNNIFGGSSASEDGLAVFPPPRAAEGLDLLGSLFMLPLLLPMLPLLGSWERPP